MKANTTPGALKRRAERIVTRDDRYDRETREAVQYSLKHDDAEDLAATVERAEAGDTIYDTRIGDERATQAARSVARLLAQPGLPHFLYDAVMLALSTAAERKGIKIASDEATGFDLRALADLFAVAGGAHHGIEFEPKKDLAELLSAVLNHPDTPTDLYNAIGDEIAAMDFDCDAPEYIRLSLEGRKPAAVLRDIEREEGGRN